MKYYQINYDIVIVLIDRLEISDISLPNLYLHSKETSTSPFSNSHWDSPTTWDLPESRDKFSWKTDEILQFQFANTKSYFFQICETIMSLPNNGEQALFHISEFCFYFK